MGAVAVITNLRYFCKKTGIMKILKKAVAFLVALLALFFYVADDPEIFSMVTDWERC